MEENKKIEYKYDKVEALRLALNIAEVQVSYATADLIVMINKLVEHKKGKANIMDISKIKVAHANKWRGITKEEEAEDV